MACERAICRGSQLLQRKRDSLRIWGKFSYQLRVFVAAILALAWAATVSAPNNNWSGYAVSASPFHCTAINNVTDLQNINRNLSGNYCLTQDIDASATKGWNGGAGFVPIGNAGDYYFGIGCQSCNGFTGTFNGQGHTISNLAINISVQPPSFTHDIGTLYYFAGLFGYVGTTGLVENVGLIGGSVTVAGQVLVGGLVGFNAGGVMQSYATGKVTGGAIEGAGGAIVGGLVGLNSGTVSQSYATRAVTSYSSYEVGGLVGANYDGGTVSQSYATGAVSGGGSVSYATDTTGDVGGLVGSNAGTVTQSYATGAVSGGGSYINSVGGLVGVNGGTVSQSYVTGAVSGGSYSYVGGLVGSNYNGGTVSQSYASNSGSISPDSTAAVSGGYSSYDVGGLLGFNSGTVSQSYATGSVSGGSALFGGVGGLVGINELSSNVMSSSYWDTQTTLQTNGYGINSGTFSATGLTTAQFQSGLPSGFDPTVWGSNSSINGGFPYLLWEGPTFTASATSGSAPLLVRFYVKFGYSADPNSYSVNFGDGNSGTLPANPMPMYVCAPNASKCGNPTPSFSTSHTYASAGTYTATLLNSNNATLASVTITVNSPSAEYNRLYPSAGSSHEPTPFESRTMPAMQDVPRQ